MTADFLASIIGQQIPGGCLDCDAYQVVRQAAEQVFVLEVRHDDTCPTLRVMQ